VSASSPSPDTAGTPDTAGIADTAGYRRVLDAVDEGVLLQDADARIIAVNRSAAALFGVVEADVLGQTPVGFGWAVFDADGREVPAEERPVRAAVRSGKPVSNQLLRMHIADKGERWLEVSSYPVAGADPDSIQYVVTTIRDVTDRLRAAESVHFQARLLDSVGQAVVAADLEGTILYWNRAAGAMFGWGRDEVLGANVDSVTAMADESLPDRVRRRLARGLAWSGEVDLLRKDGSAFPAAVVGSPVHDDSGAMVGFLGVVTDITERRELERTGQADRQRLAEAQRVAHLGIWEYAVDGTASTWSDELFRILGVEPDGRTELTRYLDAVHPGDRLDVLACWHAVSSGERDMQATHRLIRPDGDVRWVEIHGWQPDGTDVVRGTVLDITHRRRAEEALSHQALHDPLTGLPNRLLLDDRLVQALARGERRRGRVAVLFLDLDRFKVVNDAIGHVAGDTLLVAVAERLRSAVRPSDTVGRFAGDEFVVISEDMVGAWDADALAQRVVASFDEPFRIDGRELFVTASLGVAVSRDGTTSASLLREADAAMYRAKERGRGRVELFDDDLSAHAAERLAVESELRRALDRDELWLAYQPIVRIADGRPVGVEALLRWQRADGRGTGPAEFIPVAEDTGLIVPIGRWVLYRALNDLVAMRRSDPALASLSVSVNLSGRQLLAGDVVEVVRDELERANLEPSALHLEVTESVLMDDVDQSIEVLVALKVLGVRIAVDDFGTGYSSLSYLKRLPIDVLKVDRSFVDGLGIDPHDSSIVDAITALGRALHLRVIAEGVEDVRQLHRLDDLGCHLGQGYLWSRPAPAEAATRWLSDAVARCPALFS
jgi:diguanylate cyclase (GGDEF)-like protein/PAS domain S-box-containing protein